MTDTEPKPHSNPSPATWRIVYRLSVALAVMALIAGSIAGVSAYRIAQRAKRSGTENDTAGVQPRTERDTTHSPPPAPPAEAASEISGTPPNTFPSPPPAISPEIAAQTAGIADDRLRRDINWHIKFLNKRLKTDAWLNDTTRAIPDLFMPEIRYIRGVIHGKISHPEIVPGHHVIATVSKLDGAEMPSSLRVPAGWNGTDPLPLVLKLHGGAPFYIEKKFPVHIIPNALTIYPRARGSHDYLGVQMVALDEIVADVRRRYPVSGLYVFGISQGGMGTWLYAERHPREVTGIAVLAGNADPSQWKKNAHRVHSPPWPKTGTPPTGELVRIYRASRSPIDHVDQLAGIPVYAVHGTADTIVPVGHSDSMIRRLKQLRSPVRYDRLRMMIHRLPEAFISRTKTLMAFATGKPRSDRVPIIIPPMTFVSNVAGAPPHRVIDPTRPASFTWTKNGIENARNVAGAPPGRIDKNLLSGPAGEAFEIPFAWCLPDDAPAYLKDCFSEFSTSWTRMYGGTPRRFRDYAACVAELKKRAPNGPAAVIVVGKPTENPAQPAGDDIRVENGVVRFFGKQFTGDDIGVIALRPDPKNRGVFILSIIADSPAGYRQLFRRFGQSVDWEGDRGRFWFDYAIFDRKSCGPETLIAAGYFDHDWRFNPAYLAQGDARKRAAIPGSNWAIPEATRQNTAPADGSVWLSSLPPAKIESFRGPVGFDRSCGVDTGKLTIHGKTYRHGLGVITPATLTWNIGGKYVTFKADVGLENMSVTDRMRLIFEQVVFEVYGDGVKLAASPTLNANATPYPMIVPVTGVRVLELRIVRKSSRSWLYGPAGWGNARLIPVEHAASNPPVERKTTGDPIRK